MMNVSTKARDYMSIYLLDPKSFDLETWPSNRYSYGEYLWEIFCMIWRSGSEIQASFNLPIYHN